MAAKLLAWGGSGNDFDDGVYDYVKKVIVGEDSHGVVYIKIQYVKNGDVVQLKHGEETGTQITESEFEVKYPDEYITWIKGTYRDAHRYDNEIMSERINRITRRRRSQSPTRRIPRPVFDMDNPNLKYTVSELQFKTSYGRTSQKFGKPGPGSTPFVLEGNNGTKLVGLHGRSGRFLDAIGAYFVHVSSAFKQLEPEGGSDGESWDDGTYDGLRKVCVGEDGGRVSSVEFVYAKGDEWITHCHGMDSNERKEFELNYEDGEYIKAVEGTIDEDGSISSLIFNTSMNRSSEEFGKAVATNKFFLKARGFDKLVGFRGRSCVDRINALGANFAVVPGPSVMKLDVGFNAGLDWDDGIHDGVRMITVTYRDKYVKSVKFVYANGTETVTGDTHGSLFETDEKEEFMLHNNEYITSVEGYLGQKLANSATARAWSAHVEDFDMTMLKFNTNLTTYTVLKHSRRGYVGVPFNFEVKDHKIVGFYGKSLKQLGVYVKPIHDA